MRHSSTRSLTVGTQSQDTDVKLKIEDLVSSANIAEKFNASADGRSFLTQLGEDVVREYREDKDSRKEWEERQAASMKLALQVVEEKSYPFANASNIKFPLVTIAAMQFHARAYPALIESANVVKTYVIGDDPTGEESARGARVAAHMNYQLHVEDPQWEENTDRAYLALPIVGCVFKKTYFDKVAGVNRSVLVLPGDLVVNYWAKDLQSASRITHVLHWEKNTLIEKQRSGVFLDREILDPAQSPDDDAITQARHLAQGTRDSESVRSQFTILEQHRYDDLDGDGYKEPYVVFVREDTKEVMRIVALYFDVGDIHRVNDDTARRFEKVLSDINSEDQTEETAKQAKNVKDEIERLRSAKDNKIVRIEPMQYFTKIPFIPSPDGGFYDIGYGSLLGPINATVDTLINQLVDAGKLANTGGGLLSREIRLKKGSTSFELGEWKTTDTSAENLHKGIFPLPVREPSQVLFTLLSLLVNYAERISGSVDIMVGQNPGQNTPAETSRTMVEQGSKVFSGIYKRVYRALGEELRKMQRLNELFLEDHTKYLDLTTGKGAIISHKDYVLGDVRVIPEADPSIAGDSQKVHQVMALKQAAATTPGYDKYEVEKRFLKAFKVQGIDQVYPDPKGPRAVPQPPNPKMEIEKMKQQSDQLDRELQLKLGMAQMMQEAEVNQAKIQKLQAEAIKALAEAQGVDTGHQIALIEAQIGAAKLHREGLLRAVEIMQKSIGGAQGGNQSGAAKSVGSESGNAGGSVESQGKASGDA
jgi:chaperonin GroES